MAVRSRFGVPEGKTCEGDALPIIQNCSFGKVGEAGFGFSRLSHLLNNPVIGGQTVTIAPQTVFICAPHKIRSQIDIKQAVVG